VPFLRYATGDVGALSARHCACGRALPLLEEIAGRSNDCIVAPDGRLINDQALVYLLREIDGIERFRIRQTTLNRLHVQIVRNERFAANSEERLRKGWCALFRVPIDVTFEYLPCFPSERSGKFRHIISDISGPQDLQAISNIVGGEIERN
jgi:phenylacetate-CoA ligase